MSDRIEELLTRTYYPSEIYDIDNLFDNLKEAIKDELGILEVPKEPIKPILIRNHTLEDIQSYMVSFKNYEDSLKDFQEREDRYFSDFSKTSGIFKRFIKNISGVDKIPSEYRENLFSYALRNLSIDLGDVNTMEDIISYYKEIYYKLIELMEIFK